MKSSSGRNIELQSTSGLARAAAMQSVHAQGCVYKGFSQHLFFHPEDIDVSGLEPR